MMGFVSSLKALRHEPKGLFVIRGEAYEVTVRVGLWPAKP